VVTCVKAAIEEIVVLLPLRELTKLLFHSSEVSLGEPENTTTTVLSSVIRTFKFILLL
jgi:hypothetical protein